MLPDQLEVQVVLEALEVCVDMSRNRYRSGLVLRRVGLDLMLESIIVDIICGATVSCQPRLLGGRAKRLSSQ